MRPIFGEDGWLDPHLYFLCQTNWRAFFRKNGLGVISDKQFRGWREDSNSINVCAVWMARITGGYRGEGWYQINTSASVLDKNYPVLSARRWTRPSAISTHSRFLSVAAGWGCTGSVRYMESGGDDGGIIYCSRWG